MNPTRFTANTMPRNRRMRFRVFSVSWNVRVSPASSRWSTLWMGRAAAQSRRLNTARGGSTRPPMNPNTAGKKSETSPVPRMRPSRKYTTDCISR